MYYTKQNTRQQKIRPVTDSIQHFRYGIRAIESREAEVRYLASFSLRLLTE